MPRSHGKRIDLLDGATNDLIATVPVGTQPVAVGVNPLTNKIYVLNAHGSTVTVIVQIFLAEVLTMSGEARHARAVMKF